MFFTLDGLLRIRIRIFDMYISFSELYWRADEVTDVG